MSSKKAIKDFRNVTGASIAVARDLMKQFNNDVNRAIDHFYANRNSFPAQEKKKESTPVGNANKLSAVFNSYAGEGEDVDAMFDDGLQRFFNDIKVNPEGLTSMAVAWKIGAAAPGEFSRNEFTVGFAKLGCSSLADITKFVSTLERDTRNKKQDFETFYKWCFKFCLDEERKQLDVPVGHQLWSILLPDSWPLKKSWLTFIENNKDLRCVSRDLWDLTIEFVNTIKPNMSNYDPDEGAWPVAIDEFCESVLAQQKK